MKIEITQLKSDINQNANLAIDNDSRLKEARLEAQMIESGVATMELRGDVQAAVHGIARQPRVGDKSSGT